MESKRSVLFKVSTILKKKLESLVRHVISLTKEVFYLLFILSIKMLKLKVNLRDFAKTDQNFHVIEDQFLLQHLY